MFFLKHGVDARVNATSRIYNSLNFVPFQNFVFYNNAFSFNILYEVKLSSF